MNTTDTLISSEIQSIDFDLSIDNACFAQTSTIKGTYRCKAFYCFRNDDTREDGEDRCSTEAFATICDTLIKSLKSNVCECNTKVNYELTITTINKQKLSFKSQVLMPDADTDTTHLSPKTLKSIIEILYNHIPEYTFLQVFLPYI